MSPENESIGQLLEELDFPCSHRPRWEHIQEATTQDRHSHAEAWEQKNDLKERFQKWQKTNP